MDLLGKLVGAMLVAGIVAIASIILIAVLLGSTVLWVRRRRRLLRLLAELEAMDAHEAPAVSAAVGDAAEDGAEP